MNFVGLSRLPMHVHASGRSFTKLYLLQIFLVCIAAGCQDNAEDCNEDLYGISTSDRDWVVEQCGTYVGFGTYGPSPIQKSSDLPTDVRKRVHLHLTQRLGTSYYSNLAFVRGEYVDKSELYRVNPHAKDYKWAVYSYRLLYRLKDESKGIKAYTAEITLDQSGKVIEEIELPPTRLFPHKVNVISTQEAYAIANRAPAYSAAQEVDDPIDAEQLRMWYSVEFESLVYRFRKVVAYDGYRTDFQIVEIDAHSGEVLAESQAFGIQ